MILCQTNSDLINLNSFINAYNLNMKGFLHGLDSAYERKTGEEQKWKVKLPYTKIRTTKTKKIKVV